MIIELTVRECAERERVHVDTIYRWIAKELVTIRRTPGGGIRIIYEQPSTTTPHGSHA